MKNILMVSVLILLSSCVLQKPTPNLFQDIEGYWVFHKDYPEGCQEKKWRQITFTDEFSRVKFTLGTPFTDKEGRPYSEYFYKVIGTSENSLTLFMEDEDRKAPDGSLITWELELDSSNVFVWKMSHWGANVPNSAKNVWPYRRIRCEST